jgi:hypothetical protein
VLCVSCRPSRGLLSGVEGPGGGQRVQVAVTVKRLSLSLVDDRPLETLHCSLHDIAAYAIRTQHETTV